MYIVFIIFNHNRACWIIAVYPVIDHGFRHNTVKEAVWDPQLLWQCYGEIHCQ